MTEAEADAFAGLMSTFLPEGNGEGGLGIGGAALPGLESIQAALRKKTVSRELNWAKKTKATLTREQEERLDELKEIMLSFQTDRELLAWSMGAVFDFPLTSSGERTLFPDPRTAFADHNALDSASFANTVSPSAMPRGPFSPIYSELLLALFILLRDTHLQPNSALHVFALASVTPHSYVLGCTTALYNEVLRTRWMEGDVISVGVALEEMRSGGVRIDDGTRAIVAAVGEAIRNDGRRADDRAKAELPTPLLSERTSTAFASRSSWPAFDEASSNVSRFTDAQINAFRFFSTRQIAAWGKMERIVEENQDERAQQKVDKEDEAREEWESRKASSYGRLAEVDSRDSRDEYEEDWRGEREERPQGLSSRRRGESRAFESEDRPPRPASPPVRDSIRLEDFIEEGEEEYDENGIDKSWKNFPNFPARTEEDRRARDKSAWTRRTDLFGQGVRVPEDGRTNSSAFSERGSYGGNSDQAPGPQSPSSFFDNEISRSPARFDTTDERTRRESYENANNESEEYDAGEEKPRRMSNREKEREPKFEAGGILPKRPSTLNPFKIRRKGLSKVEKARFDNPHPLLFWKQPKK